MAGRARGATGAVSDAPRRSLRPALCTSPGGDRRVCEVVVAMRWLGLVAALLAALLAGVVFGPAAVPIADLVHSPIVRDLRLPRALLGLLVGGSLGLAGASLQ